MGGQVKRWVRWVVPLGALEWANHQKSLQKKNPKSTLTRAKSTTHLTNSLIPYLGLGPRGPNLHPALLALLLCQHGRDFIRRRFRGPGSHSNEQSGVGCHAGGGGAKIRHSGRPGEQAGHGGGS